MLSGGIKTPSEIPKRSGCLARLPSENLATGGRSCKSKLLVMVGEPSKCGLASPRSLATLQLLD